MKLKRLYQDEQGHWHIDYSLRHLVTLCFAVWIAEAIISLIGAAIFGLAYLIYSFGS